ncbi:ankyrin repeat domain-containing protein 50-like [Mercenaria mercenaria]|uniref:ankyrin repeat domain-containing protein 50-like n=1 Tax=Mercenaria mercenaria TaxID=6596 RepID=UPI00234ED75A|nr:ankyrin repeat domain-containing protein 50-like [Mercenaria mercenaria]
MAQQTPLYVASWRGKDEIVKILIEAGADVNIHDKDGWLPIHWALRLQKADMVEYLVKNGSLLDRPTGQAKRSPFITAVVEKKYQIAQILLKHGADCTLKQKACEIIKSILKDSQMKGSMKLEVIQVLIKCGISCFQSDLVLCLANKFTSDDERKTLLLDFEKRDKSLTGICRSSLREHLRLCCRGRSIYSSVQQLPIPQVLKEYITFDKDFRVF